ncbi:MAG TPA: protein kinase [Saprospiraceae bacterium]|nr:protein kinase [Saprospiraceae bacterium]
MSDKPTLETLVCEGKLPEAISSLKSLIENLKNDPYNNLLALSGRYSSNSKASDGGTELRSMTEMETNRMRVTFLNILADVREEIEDKINFFKPIPRSEKDDKTLRHFIETTLSRKYSNIEDFAKGQSFIYFRAKERHSSQEVMIMVMKTSDIEEIKKNSQLNLISKLKHRNLIQLLDVNFQTYPYYLITEMVMGVDLKKLLRNTGTIPLYNAKRILMVIGDVMDYLRQKNFKHSGIRPSKIIIDHEMEPEVSPFDIHQVSESRRLLSAFMEECHYFAPEWLMDTERDRRKSDAIDKANQFCLAALGFEMLTGEKLFAGENVAEVLYNRHQFFTDSEYRKQRLAHPQLPTRMVAIFKKMLAENPQKRYDDMTMATRDIGRVRVDLDENEKIVFESYRRCLGNAENFSEVFFDRLFGHPDMAPHRPDTPELKTLLFQRFHIAVHLMFDIENTVNSVEKTTRLSPLESNTRSEYLHLLNTFILTVADHDPRWEIRPQIGQAWKHIRDRILESLDNILPPDPPAPAEHDVEQPDPGAQAQPAPQESIAINADLSFPDQETPSSQDSPASEGEIDPEKM